LPKCQARNADPTGKRAKDTKTEANKAAKAEKVKKMAEAAQNAESAKERLAEMEVDESFVQNEECAHQVRQWSNPKSPKAESGMEDYDAKSDDSESEEEPGESIQVSSPH
jgi:hypothetical protein